MYRPYIVCHMVTSIDGKVTGEFLSRPECESATEIYYEMNIEDSDPGYGGAMIIEVLTEQVDPRYLAYLEEKAISYFFAGETEIDVPLALKILRDHLSPEFYVLEGGSIINGHFLRADCVDEISLVQAPITADKDSKSLFMDGDVFDFELTETEQKNGALVMRYVRPREE